MILIAHRGNTGGSVSELENNPSYIVEALEQGFDVELDLWYTDNIWMLGHDEPQYAINFDFLLQPRLWIHCKNYVALQALIPFHNELNFFYHTNEDYALTSKQYIWAYPGNPGGKYTICVMPEWNKYSTDGFVGICSDYVERYR